MAEFVSLFSGAGGLDLGLELGGWSCLFATDHDPRAIQTLSLNRGKSIAGVPIFSGAAIECADVSALKGKQILTKTAKRRGEISLLAGGPPCQSWSSAGHQRGFADARGRLFEDYIRIASDLDVRWLLFENVRGLLTARGQDGVPGSAIAHLRGELLRAGWQTTINLLNSADFGVPQRRVRLIVIGYRTGDAPRFPAPTHSVEHNLVHAPWISLGEAIQKIAPPTADEIIRPNQKLQAELRALKPGSGVKSPGKKEATRPGGHWGYKQGAFLADASIPARTITANAQQDWIKDGRRGTRRLTPRECAALQTFPPEWEFDGSRADKYRLIGNAVPPKLAEALGRALLEQTRNTQIMPRRKGRSETSTKTQPAPLPPRLQAAIDYTRREDLRNGPSRRAAPAKRVAKLAP